MGSYVSKSEIASVEANAVSLIIRIEEENGVIDEYVKQRISKALCVYSDRLDKESKKGYLSRQKVSKMKGLISQAKMKVEILLSKKISKKPTAKTPYEMKVYLLEVMKQMEKEKIRDHEYYVKVFHTVTQYAQNLEHSSEFSLSREENDNLSVLFLKLFLKSPRIKATNILEKVNHNVNDILEYFEMFDMKSVTAFNSEEVMNKLRQMQPKIEKIKQKTLEGIENLQRAQKTCEKQSGPSKSNVSWHLSLEQYSRGPTKSEPENNQKIIQFDNILKQIQTVLNECKTVVENLSPPVSNFVVMTLKDKISTLVEIRLNTIPKDMGISAKKEILYNRADEILNRLTKINEENREIEENLNTLKYVQDKIFVFLEEKNHFQETIKGLETFAEIVTEINTHNSEVKIQKTEIANKIEGFLVAESLSYLRQVKKMIHYHKICAQQFSYPKGYNLYELKNNEISSLSNNFDDLPKGRNCVDERVKFVLQEIGQALEILNIKATSNERVLSTLEYLEHINRTIHWNYNAPQSQLDKLYAFSESRRMIHCIDNFHQRLCSKKSQIRNQLHIFEEKIYLSRYPEEIQVIKASLDEQEKSAQQCTFPIYSELYESKKRDILNLWKKLESIGIAQGLSSIEMKIFFQNFHFVLKLLEENSKEVKAKSQYVESLKSVENQIANLSMQFPPTKKLELLEEHYELVQIKKHSVKTTDMLNTLEKTENFILIEKFKIILSELTLTLVQLGKDIVDPTYPIDAQTFKAKISLLFSMKESVDDMPEGNPELDAQKQTFLQESFKILKRLDEHVASFVASRKYSENILNLESCFNSFNLEDMNVDKESAEFIQMIFGRAQEFEGRVKCYLGSNTSVDYYVIHENLMRLLEELDKLSCTDPDFLRSVVECITYIKDLIEQLESNASNE